MFGRIKRYKRYKDYFSVQTMEVKFAGSLTIIFCLFFEFVLEFREKFVLYITDIKQIFSMIIGGEFTLLGMSLAGLAIVVTLLSPEEMRIIEKVDKNDTINRVLSQFEFSAFNLTIQLVYLFLLYFLFMSDREVMRPLPFWAIVGVILYHFFFNIFYIVALIGSCIKINMIKRDCYKIALKERSVLGVANEIRIDYLLAIVLKDRKIDKNAFLNKLYEIIDTTNEKNKEEVKQYLRKYYNGE